MSEIAKELGCGGVVSLGRTFRSVESAETMAFVIDRYSSSIGPRRELFDTFERKLAVQALPSIPQVLPGGADTEILPCIIEAIPINMVDYKARGRLHNIAMEGNLADHATNLVAMHRINTVFYDVDLPLQSQNAIGVLIVNDGFVSPSEPNKNSHAHDSKSGPDAEECAGTKFRGGTDSPREPGLSADGRLANQPAMDETTSTLLPHDRGQDTVRGGTIRVAVEQGFESLPVLVRDHHRRGLPDNCDRPGGAVPATGMITDEAMQAGVSDLFSELVRGYDYDLLGRINFFIAIHGRDERCVSGNTINREPGDKTDLVPGQIYTDAILAQFATFGVQDHSPISVAHRDNPVAGTLQAKPDTPKC